MIFFNAQSSKNAPTRNIYSKNTFSKTQYTVFSFIISIFSSIYCSQQVQAQVGHCPQINNPSTPCYRYACDSIDSSGEFYEDSCTESCISKPSHWGSNIVQVRVGTDNLPSGNPSLTTDEWNTIVDQSLEAWSTVPASNFSFQRSSIPPLRTYGEDTNSHEIFWINDRTEWRETIQASIYSTLGITISEQGTCERIIKDSDLILNAAGIFGWSADKADCQTSGFTGCRNAKATLLHELGHYIGIGHPCSGADCLSWSVMAAVANPYAEKETLQIADHAVVSQLYPGIPGGIGSACDRTNDTCSAPLSCEQVEPLQFCTKTCDSISRFCSNGLVCDENNSHLCVFEGSIEAQIGEFCENIGQFCARGTGACVELDQQSLCLKTCSLSSSDCKPSEQCTSVSTADQDLGVCSPSKPKCNAQSGIGCAVNEHCIYPISRCLPGKSLLSEGGCPENTLCPTSAFCPEQAFCSIAGNGLEGAPCDADSVLNCAVGNICLAPSNAPEQGRCYHRCDQKFECATDQECRDLADRVNPEVAFLSYCADTNTPVDGDAGIGIIDPGNHNNNPDKECRSERGHFDCASGQLCLENNCIESSSQKKSLYQYCEEHNECEGGICAGGVCSQPCDYGDGCVKNFECLFDEQLKGDVCTPVNCSKTGCEQNLSCLLSPQGNYVCTTEQKQSCNCEQTQTNNTRKSGIFLCLLFCTYSIRRTTLKR